MGRRCCCGEPCLWAVDVPIGYGPEANTLSDFPSGSHSGTGTSDTNSQWGIGASTTGGTHDFEWGTGRVAITTSGSGATITATYRPTSTGYWQASVTSGYDLGVIETTFEQDPKDPEYQVGFSNTFWPDPCIQGTTYFEAEIDISHDITVSGSTGNVYFGPVEFRASGFWGAGWRLFYADGTSDATQRTGPFLIKCFDDRGDRLSFPYCEIYDNGTLLKTVDGGPTLNPSVLLTNEGEITIDSFSYTIGAGSEVAVAGPLNMQANYSFWSSGITPSWSKTLSSNPTPKATCDGGALNPGRWPAAWKECTQTVSVTPGRLYRIVIVSGDPVDNPVFPGLCVDNKWLIPPRYDLLPGQIETPDPYEWPGSTGAYWRAYWDTMEISLHGPETTSGSCQVYVYGVNEKFHIEYPYRYGHDAQGKGFTNWAIPIGTAYSISPNILGSPTPPITWETLNTSGQQSSGAMPPGFSTITGLFSSFPNSGNQGTGRVKATDADGRVSYSRLIKWKFVV